MLEKVLVEDASKCACRSIRVLEAAAMSTHCSDGAMELGDWGLGLGSQVNEESTGNEMTDPSEAVLVPMLGRSNCQAFGASANQRQLIRHSFRWSRHTPKRPYAGLCSWPGRGFVVHINVHYEYHIEPRPRFGYLVTW